MVEQPAHNRLVVGSIPTGPTSMVPNSTASKSADYYYTGGARVAMDIVEGTSQKPASTGELIRAFRNQSDLSGQLFTGYPIVATSEGPYPIDALMVSEDKGIIIFDLIEGTEKGDFASRQDDSANLIEARLRLHRQLLDGRNLRIPIHTISFAPGISSPETSEFHRIAGLDTVLSEIQRFSWDFPDKAVFDSALSTIESISSIRQSRTRRTLKQSDSRGAKLKNLEGSIATLDNPQSKAVIETVTGVQRIRGLAGSGKTIVLALKAAYLHANHPDWRIAVTFNTRSLKGQFRRLINNFTLEQTNQEPNWENLRVVNAWGAPGGYDRDGMYYEFCRVNDVEYLDFQTARARFGQRNPFSFACEFATKGATDSKQIYDAILIDEAQDFSPPFLRLCYKLLKDPKRLVYAYDELQNLSGESLPSPEEIFSEVDAGTDVVNFSSHSDDGPRRDIILQRCYRNSRPVLVTAHALGFGIYRDPQSDSDSGLIQMFDNPLLWTDVGYEIKSGQLTDDERVVLHRTSDTSPFFLEEHSSVEDLIDFVPFQSEEEQTNWLVDAIIKNLNEDELRCDDIVVINPNPRTTRANVGPIRRKLFDLGINSHLAGVDTSPDTFFQLDEESITFTGVFRAKGNEAGMVYIINAQDCHSSAPNLASIRNQLFTAITRSKAWIRVLGVGGGMHALVEEYGTLKRRNFELDFIYPNAEQRNQLRIVHRDMSADERSRLENRQRSLTELVDDLQAGNVRIEDINQELLAKLREFLG